jgi:hypothetical protein
LEKLKGSVNDNVIVSEMTSLLEQLKALPFTTCIIAWYYDVLRGKNKLIQMNYVRLLIKSQIELNNQWDKKDIVRSNEILGWGGALETVNCCTFLQRKLIGGC